MCSGGGHCLWDGWEYWMTYIFLHRFQCYQSLLLFCHSNADDVLIYVHRYVIFAWFDQGRGPGNWEKWRGSEGHFWLKQCVVLPAGEEKLLSITHAQTARRDSHTYTLPFTHLCQSHINFTLWVSCKVSIHLSIKISPFSIPKEKRWTGDT